MKRLPAWLPWALVALAVWLVWRRQARAKGGQAVPGGTINLSDIGAEIVDEDRTPELYEAIMRYPSQMPQTLTVEDGSKSLTFTWATPKKKK